LSVGTISIADIKVEARLGKGKKGNRYDEAFKREAIALVIEKHIPLSKALSNLELLKRHCDNGLPRMA